MSQQKLNLPQHIAIIMDGNGRWAKKRHMPRVYGHRQGVQSIKKVVRRASDLGIKVLTFFAFSTENWKRPEDEVRYLMKLPEDFFREYLKEIMERNAKVTVIGDIEGLPKGTHKVLLEVLESTKDNTGMIINFAINYGSQQEIVQTARTLGQKISLGALDPEDIDLDLFEAHLSTGFLGGLSRPDLLIRTSGEERISNFLLWQCAYSEFYFTDIYWPDFDGESLEKAIQAYCQRNRRFGALRE